MTVTLIWMDWCAGWSAPLLFAYGINRFFYDLTHKFIWAIAWPNQQNDLCAQWRLRSAWASIWRNIGPLIICWAHCEDSDQTGLMPGSESSLGAHVILLGFVVWRLKFSKFMKQRLTSAWAQCDQSSLCALWVAKDLNLLQAEREDFDQTRRMPRLVGVIIERTNCFVMLQLMYCICICQVIDIMSAWGVLESQLLKDTR